MSWRKVPCRSTSLSCFAVDIRHLGSMLGQRPVLTGAPAVSMQTCQHIYVGTAAERCGFLQKDLFR